MYAQTQLVPGVDVITTNQPKFFELCRTPPSVVIFIPCVKSVLELTCERRIDTLVPSTSNLMKNQDKLYVSIRGKNTGDDRKR